MCNAVLSPSNRENPMCIICHGDFDLSSHEEQWNHVGGEGHDPFHKNCLREWVLVRPTCPYEMTPINPYSLVSRTEMFFKKTRPAFVNLACAVFLGAAGGASAAAVTDTGLMADAAVVGGVIAGGVATSAVVGVINGGEGAGGTVVAALLFSLAATATSSEAGAAAGAAFGALTFFECLRIAPGDQLIIGMGTFMGSMITRFISRSAVPTTIATISLASGFFSGIGTFFKHH